VYAITSRQLLVPIQFHAQLVLGIELPEHQTYHSPLSRAEFKNARSYTFTALYVLIAWWLIKHRATLHFYNEERKKDGNIPVHERSI
jgi:hypothetical protein